MELRSASFKYANELTQFVKKFEIKRENIQQILSIRDCMVLFYWEV